MKKLFTILMCASFVLAAHAQSAFTISPTTIGDDEDVLNFLGESMSENSVWVVGTDMETGNATAWNTTNNTIKQIVEIDPETEESLWFMGSLHHVNNNGIAVGSLLDFADNATPIMFNCATGTYTRLQGDESAEAYGITEDGSTIVGFYFITDWTVAPCIWTNNGQARIDLPLPTETQMGFAIDYASARWISADGSTILGYVTDHANAKWIAVAWQRQGDNYTVVPFSTQFYFSYDVEAGEDVPSDANPYFHFEPMGLSANGEWAVINVIPTSGINDFDIFMQVARYNFTTNRLEVMAAPEDCEDDIIPATIDNRGNVGGRIGGNFYMGTTDAFLWKSDTTGCNLLQEMFSTDPYTTTWNSSSINRISSETGKGMGFVIDDAFNFSSFVVDLVEGVGIKENEKPAPAAVEGIYDMTGRKLDRITTPGVYVINGKKTYVNEIK